MVPTWRKYILSTTSAAPSQMTADWKMNSIAESTVQRLVLAVYLDRIWSSHDISKKTKISVYTAAITSALLIRAESWTLYQKHFVRLRRAQQRHLRAILCVPYTDRITNDQILDRGGVPDIEMIVRKMQLRGDGHVERMSADRIPKQLIFGELTTGTKTYRPPTSALEGLAQIHFKTIKHFHNAMARHRN